MRFINETDYRHDKPEAIGILLTNLGTPEAPTAPALRRYLAEFLSDRRVVELPRAKWLPILHGIILRTRPRKSAALYRNIWTPEGSPLLVISRRQLEGLRWRLERRITAPLHVALGMRYGEPSIAGALEELRRENCRRLLVLPLYPQYGAATVGSTFDAIAEVLRRRRWVPELRMITHYHDEAGYIRALAASVREHWERSGRGDRLLMSFHGLPRSSLHRGDPYHCHCQKSARLLAQELEISDGEWLLTFQSRFGREVWLQPYTDRTLESLAKAGVGRIDIMAPGFSADCLETLEELAMTNRHLFEHAGGREYRYIPALNDRADHLEFLTDMIERQLAGWMTTVPQRDTEATQRELQARLSRARILAAQGLNGPLPDDSRV